MTAAGRPGAGRQGRGGDREATGSGPATGGRRDAARTTTWTLVTFCR